MFQFVGIADDVNRPDAAVRQFKSHGLLQFAVQENQQAGFGIDRGEADLNVSLRPLVKPVDIDEKSRHPGPHRDSG